jgi:N-acetylglucosamine-6-phosphate deacetylase
LKSFVLTASRLATPVEVIPSGYLAVKEGRVRSLGSGAPPGGLGPVLDLGDVLVAPGFVDLHVHGGGGDEVNCASPDEAAASVRRLAWFHATHGTTSLVPTTVSDTTEVLLAAVRGIAAVAREGGSGVLGSNLEGPWLSPRRAGAQFPGALRPPSLAELAQLLEAASGTLRLLTLAPELEGAMELIAAARAAGVVVSIGHTDADYETARAAFDAGVTQATHLFNAMAPIHQRRPGPVTAALSDPRVGLELVADGAHVHPALISLVASLAPERLLLITDAIAAAGAPPGRYRLGPQEVVVSDGRALLAGHKDIVAGSVLTMERAVAVATQLAGVPLLTALRAASLQPARAVGARAKGHLAPGADADIVVLSHGFEVVATIAGGNPVYDPTGLLGALGAPAAGGDGSAPGTEPSQARA